MRITNVSRREHALREIQGNLGRLSELEAQVATGKRFSKAEQDPVATTVVLWARRGSRAIDQFAKNGTAVQVRLGAEQAVLQQADDLLRQARDAALTFAKGDPPYTTTQADERRIAADQITGLLDQLIAIGNTKIGDEYILAGEKSTTPPFDETVGATYGDYQGGTIQRRIQVAEGVDVAPNHTGDQYLGPTITALRALRDAVEPANLQTEAQVQAAVVNVFTTSQQIQVSLAQSGSTGNQVIALLKSNTLIKNDLETARSNVQDVSAEESIAKLLSLQTTVEASYAATSRLLSLNLTDYLR